MPEIVNYVSHGAARITPAIVEKVLRHLPLWKVEFTQIDAAKYPHLIDQLVFLADVVEDFTDGADKEIPYVVMAEAVFALMYAHKRVDIIPDFVLNIGRADDSSVVRAVLIRNEKALSNYAARHNGNWLRLSIKP